MKNQLGIIVLIVICVGLIAALVYNQKQATAQHQQAESTISTLSNQWVQTSTDLDKQRQVNTTLEGDLKQERESYLKLTNDYTTATATLDQTAATLKTTQEQKEQMAKDVAARDTRIAELESQNLALDQRAADLSNAITNLTTQIASTQKKLAASEGDKAFLEKELQRLMTEKAELERQFNDLTVLRAQVTKLKEELAVSRRLEWIRQGLFARDTQKGAQQLMIKTPAPAASTNAADQNPKGKYDLNVEVNADGTVRVIPPTTNSPPHAP